MIEREVSLKDLSVCVGIPAGRDLHPLTVKSLLATQGLCIKHGVPFESVLIAGSSVVQWARDEVVDLFLKSKSNRLFWIDSDMIWEPNDFMRMLAVSQYNEVICASYPAKMDTPTFFMLYDEDKDLVVDEWDNIDVLGAGLGFTVMNRKVINELCDKAPVIKDQVTGKEMYSLFRVGMNEKGNRQGEDMAFFEDIRNLGYTVKMDTSVKLGHIGTKVYRGDIMNALKLKDDNA